MPPPTEEGVTVKKGEAVWLFLQRGGRRMSERREWPRVRSMIYSLFAGK